MTTTATGWLPLVIEGVSFDPTKTYTVLMATDLSLRIIVDSRVKACGHSIDHGLGKLVINVNNELSIGDLGLGMWATFKQEIIPNSSKKTWLITKSIPDLFERRGLVEQIIKEGKAAGCDRPVFVL